MAGLRGNILKLIFLTTIHHFGVEGTNPSTANRMESSGKNDSAVVGDSFTFAYFAYGSNMWADRIHINNPSATRKSVGLLHNYKLEFAYYSRRWRGGVASILPTKKSNVYGVLWELNMKDLPSLDRQEGVANGIYERFKVNIVKSNGETVECWTYKLTALTRARSIATYGKDLKPSMEYKNVIIRGAQENGLPPSYINALKSIPASP